MKTILHPFYKYFLSVILLTQGFISLGQVPAIWYFGNKAGIDFTTSPPTALYNANINTNENSSVLTDQYDSLVFYTSGATVWDKNHNVMPNGTGLFGGESSAQGSIILPKPFDCDTVYIFTTQDHSASTITFRYTAVSLSANGGLGAVVSSQKNVLIMSNVAEAQTSIRHANGRDYWIVVHGLGTNNTNFHAFLVTPSGVSTTPVTTSIGNAQASNLMIGVLKANHKGNKIARTIGWGTDLEVFDFNNATGVLSNRVSIASGGHYGIEFSPNDSLLYFGAGFNTLKQYNFATGNTAIISSSSVLYSIGGLSEDNQGRIFVGRDGYTSFYAIQNPNVVGTGCNFGAVLTAASGTNSRLSLPHHSTIVKMSLDPLQDFSACVFPVTVSMPAAVGYEYTWSTGDTTPSIIINNPGIYSVAATNGCDTVIDTVTVSNPINYTLGNDSSLCSGQPMVLYDTIPPGVSVLWSDGSTNDSLIISSPGVYWVEWTDGSCVKRDTITVSSLATINGIQLLSSDSCGLSILVADSISSQSCMWNFGDGTISTQSSTSHTYAAPGTYQITLVEGFGTACADTSMIQVTVDTIIQASFTTVADFCTSNAMFQGSSTGFWDLGDGTSSFGNSASNFYNPGNYQISFITTSSISGCKDTADTSLNFYSSPVSSFTVFSDTCSSEVQFTNTSTANSYFWDFGDGTVATQTNPIHIYPAAGNYTVTLIADPGTNCSDTSSMIVFAGSSPVASFNYSVGTCDGMLQTINLSTGTTTNLWTFGDGGISAASSPTYAYSSPGTYQVILEIQDSIGCVDRDTAIVSIDLNPQANFTFTVPVCQDTIHFINTTSGALSYLWSFDDGNSSNQASPSHYYNTGGIFNVSLISYSQAGQNGCSDTVVQTVNLNNIVYPELTMTGASGCAPVCIQFNLSNIQSGNDVVNSVMYNFGDGNGSIDFNPSYCFATPGKYYPSVTVQTQNGCSVILKASDTVEVFYSPVAAFSGPDSVYFPDGMASYTNHSTGATNYNWSCFPGAEDGFSNAKDASWQFDGPGTYYIVLEAWSDSGCIDTAMRLITVLNEPILFVPNAFTPNNDNLNEIFIPYGYGIKDIKFEVYDRWGLKIFESNNIDIGWNGYYRGEPAPVDVYIYRVVYETENNQFYQKEGHFSLIR